MSKADEMFKKLGYKLICSHINPENSTNYQFIYENKQNNPTTIEFNKSEIFGEEIFITQKELFSNIYDKRLSLSILQAINEKVKELGWLDE